MIDRQRLRRHALGSALVFAWLFLALSLVGFHPSDPPGSASWSPGTVPVRNPCGPVGALLAHLVFQAIGWAAALLLLSLAAAGLHVFRRRAVPEPALRLIGLGLVLVVAASMFGALDARIGASLLPRSPAVGSGGYVGAIVSTFLASQFGPVGLVLILTASGLLGGLLCHD